MSIKNKPKIKKYSKYPTLKLHSIPILKNLILKKLLSLCLK